MAGPVLDFKLAGLAGQVSAHGLFERGAIVWVDQGHAGLMVDWGIGVFVAELLPDVHVGPTAVPVVAVGHVNFPDADAGSAYRQLEAGVGPPKLFLGAPPAGAVPSTRNPRLGRLPNT